METNNPNAELKLKIKLSRNWFGRLMERVGLIKPIMIELLIKSGSIKVNSSDKKILDNIVIEFDNKSSLVELHNPFHEFEKQMNNFREN